MYKNEIFPLLELIRKTITNCEQEDDGSDLSLFNGKTSHLLFLLEYNKIQHSNTTELYINKILDEIFELFYQGNIEEGSLSGGIAGYVWFFNYINRFHNFDISTTEIENIILNSILLELESNNNLDSLHGTLGKIKAITSIFSHKNTVKDSVLKKIIDTMISKEIHEYNFEDKIDFGLAHGLSGILVILCNFYKQGYLKENNFSVLQNIANYIRQSKLTFGVYPHILKEGAVQSSGREAWCYGDLCVAYSFLFYSNISGDIKFKAEANHILKSLVGRPIIESGIEKDNLGNIDPSLCHGSSGVYFIYNYLEKYFPYCRPRKLETLKMTVEQTKRNLLQDKFIRPSLSPVFSTRVWYQERSLLYGYSGIGLSLLELLKTNESQAPWAEIINLY